MQESASDAPCSAFSTHTHTLTLTHLLAYLLLVWICLSSCTCSRRTGSAHAEDAEVLIEIREKIEIRAQSQLQKFRKSIKFPMKAMGKKNDKCLSHVRSKGSNSHLCRAAYALIDPAPHNGALIKACLTIIAQHTKVRPRLLRQKLTVSSWGRVWPLL